ncbi:hypothetical protein HFN76_18285 [Rhizobium laguerreae]|nr:hypothetical protein [Rhizobium laguerreae]
MLHNSGFLHARRDLPRTWARCPRHSLQDGLTSGEADERVRRFGPNSLFRKRRRHLSRVNSIAPPTPPARDRGLREKDATRMTPH